MAANRAVDDLVDVVRLARASPKISVPLFVFEFAQDDPRA